MLKQSINLAPSRPDLYQAKLVFYLFIGSLGMFFLASLITYCLIRIEAFRSVQMAYDAATNSMQPIDRSYRPLELPISFWTSTLLLVAISVFLQRACWMVHREQQVRFRRALIWAWIAAIGFIAIQSLGMSELLSEHFSGTNGSNKVYGMSFTLALIHALHVFGGIVFLGFVIYQAFRDRYDHERHWAVDHCASYWHFLDVVWLSMLVVFAVTR